MALLIGIAGDSGTGKSTIAHYLARFLGDAVVVELDNYHRYGRYERRKLGISPLNPEANDFELIYENLKDLKENKEVRAPLYDHEKGVAMASWIKIKPAKFVIAEGLLPFYTKELRDLFDVKIFVEPRKELQVIWKLLRDSKKRNYKIEFDLAERIKDYKLYVLPQKKYADFIFQQDFSEYSREGVGCRLVLKTKRYLPRISFSEALYSFSISFTEGYEEIWLDGNMNPLFEVKTPVEACCKIIAEMIRRW